MSERNVAACKTSEQAEDFWTTRLARPVERREPSMNERDCRQAKPLRHRANLQGANGYTWPGMGEVN